MGSALGAPMMARVTKQAPESARRGTRNSWTPTRQISKQAMPEDGAALAARVKNGIETLAIDFPASAARTLTSQVVRNTAGQDHPVDSVNWVRDLAPALPFDVVVVIGTSRGHG